MAGHGIEPDKVGIQVVGLLLDGLTPDRPTGPGARKAVPAR